jgi:hypothetical protein
MRVEDIIKTLETASESRMKLSAAKALLTLDSAAIEEKAYELYNFFLSDQARGQLVSGQGADRYVKLYIVLALSKNSVPLRNGLLEAELTSKKLANLDRSLTETDELLTEQAARIKPEVRTAFLRFKKEIVADLIDMLGECTRYNVRCLLVELIGRHGEKSHALHVVELLESEDESLSSSCCYIAEKLVGKPVLNQGLVFKQGLFPVTNAA